MGKARKATCASVCLSEGGQRGTGWEQEGWKTETRRKQILKALKHAERCTLHSWELSSEEKGPGRAELPFRSTTLGYTLPKDTYGLPPRNRICKDIFPYQIIACT